MPIFGGPASVILIYIDLKWYRDKIIAELEYDNLYWIKIIRADPEPSGFAKSPIEINREIFEVRNVFQNQFQVDGKLEIQVVDLTF